MLFLDLSAFNASIDQKSELYLKKYVTSPIIMIKTSLYKSTTCCSTQENCLIYCSTMDDSCKAFQFMNGVCWTSSAMSFYRYSNTNMQQISMWIAPDKATHTIKRKLSCLSYDCIINCFHQYFLPITLVVWALALCSYLTFYWTHSCCLQLHQSAQAMWQTQMQPVAWLMEQVGVVIQVCLAAEPGFDLKVPLAPPYPQLLSMRACVAHMGLGGSVEYIQSALDQVPMAQLVLTMEQHALLAIWLISLTAVLSLFIILWIQEIALYATALSSPWLWIKVELN